MCSEGMCDWMLPCGMTRAYTTKWKASTCLGFISSPRVIHGDRIPSSIRITQGHLPGEQFQVYLFSCLPLLAMSAPLRVRSIPYV